jgi:hypothetical protein
MKQNRLQALCILSASAVFSGNVAAYGLGDIGPAVLGFTMGTGFTLQRTIQDIHTWQSNTQLYGVPMSPTLFNPLLATEVSPGLTVKEALSNVGAPIDLTSLPTVDLITSLPAAILNLRIIDNVDGSLNTNTLKEKTQEISRFAWETNKKIKELTDPVTGLSTKVTGIDNRLFNVANWAYDTNKLLLPKLATEVTSVKADVTGMVTDVTDVKNDVSGMVSDLGLVKATVDTLSTSLDSIGPGLDSISSLTTVLTPQVISGLSDIPDILTTVSSEVSSLAGDIPELVTKVGEQATELGLLKNEIALATAVATRTKELLDDPSLATALGVLAEDSGSFITKIEDTASDIQSVADSTASLASLISNINGVTSQMPTGITEDIGNALSSAQELLDVSRNHLLVAKNNHEQGLHANPVELLNSTVDIINLLKGGVGPDVDISLLTGLLAGGDSALPTQLKAALGEALLLAGISQEFVAKLQQAVIDLPQLGQVVGLDLLEESELVFAAGSGLIPQSCSDLVDQRIFWGGVLAVLSETGVVLKGTGAIVKGFSKTAVHGPFSNVHIAPGVHGYAALKIEHDNLKLIGELIDGAGDLLIGHVDAAGSSLRQCEIRHINRTNVATVEQRFVDIVGDGPWEPGQPLNRAHTLAGIGDGIANANLSLALIRTTVGGLPTSISTVGTGIDDVVTKVGQVDDKVASLGSDVAMVIDDLGVIDTAINSGVTGINNKIDLALVAIERVETVIANTGGTTIVTNLETVVENAARMQTLLNNVNNITEQMPAGIDVELSNMLMAAQNLIEFSRGRAADAESLASTFVDQGRLISATYNLADALKGDVLDEIQFHVLLDLLNAMPYQLVNLSGYGLKLVGVNASFIEKIEQAALDVALLREVKSSNSEATGSAVFLPAGSTRSCQFVEGNRSDIKASAQRVSDLGNAFTIIGKSLIAFGSTAVKMPDEPVIGVHGYAGFNVKNDLWKKFGSIFSGIGEVLSPMADSTDNKLNHCEVILYQQALLETTCYLTRGRGPMCQRWVGSEEQSNMLN